VFALLVAGSAAQAADPIAPTGDLGPCPAKYENCNWGFLMNPWGWNLFELAWWEWTHDDSFGVAFTPTKSTTIRTISVALGYVSGTNAATISLYTDSGGVPGKALVSQDVTDIANVGTCCSYSTIKARGVALTAGTQYWVVVGYAGGVGGAYTNTRDTVDSFLMAENNGSGWVAFESTSPFNYKIK
jgi:hypothetical protein